MTSRARSGNGAGRGGATLDRNLKLGLRSDRPRLSAEIRCTPRRAGAAAAGPVLAEMQSTVPCQGALASMGDYGRYSWANYIKIPAGAVLGTGNLGRKWGHPRGRDGDSY